MLKSKVRPATYADIEALPPHVTGEILFGVLHTHPRPAPRHSVAHVSLMLLQHEAQEIR
jgi:proteasome lid subunit RPN8/RPN11